MKTIQIKIGDILRSVTGRVMLALYLFCSVVCAGFLIYTYFSQIENSKRSEINKLEAIARSLAVQIEGEGHQRLVDAFPNKDGISNLGQSEFYTRTHLILRRAADENNLNSDIYTLFYNEGEGLFEFGVTSAETPYYRHEWKEFSPEHIERYETGSNLGPYRDEHGTWLSAFSPIRDLQGNTVGILQVDEPFDKFIAAANASIIRQILTLLGVFVLMGIAMLIYIQKILSKEDSLKSLLNQQRNEISAKNKEITHSINRAKFIQDALLPDQEIMQRAFPEMFILFQPRDIVSGDFYWFAEKDDSVFMAVADCTGHGVPGAFMSMIGHTILNEVVHYSGEQTPAKILGALDRVLSEMLLSKSQKMRDGMDIALVRYCKKTSNLQFAGALRPLVHMKGGNLELIRGDKHAIGGFQDKEKDFTNHEVDVEPGDRIYMFSDGYSDQFGGDLNKKYKSRRFYEFLKFAQEHPLDEQKHLLNYEFHHWKDTEAQLDDMLVMGIKIPEAA